MMDYQTLVFELLKNKYYPVLEDCVIIDIYHKFLKPISTGKQYASSMNPEVLFERENEATKIVYLTHQHPFIYLHKEEVNTIDLKNLPIDCIRVKINKGFINKVLRTNYKYFEEEIYKFITELNFNIPNIRDILNLSFVDSTRFIPTSIQMWISRYKTMRITDVCINKDNFGPKTELIDTRMILGKLSKCTSNSKILSMRDPTPLENEEDEEEIPFHIINTEKYTFHYIPEYNTIIPLAFNPLENPIIQ